MAFSTRLVGVNSDNTPTDLGIGFTWTSNHNGTTGGIATTATIGPADPDSGDGGVTIVSVQQTTDFSGVTVTGLNGNAIPPALTVNDVAVAEPHSGSTNAVFSVNLSKSSTQTVLVDYFTSNGTATAPTDYQSINGTLTFAPGDTSRTIIVPVNTDPVNRGDETFFINLSNPSNATIARRQGQGTIVDNDPVGIFRFTSSSTSALENEGVANLIIVRTGDTTQLATIDFETHDLTAHQKNDYTYSSGTVQFAPGEVTKTINVPIVNDGLVDGSRDFEVILSDPSSKAGVGNPDSILVTIIDDDSAAAATNPIDDSQFFVRQHYLDFLGREPDPNGFSFWTGQINACGTDPVCVNERRIQVSAAFFLSIEFQETGGYVSRMARVAFGRQSEDPFTRLPYFQFMRDTHEVGQGVIVGQPGFDAVLEQNKQTYAERTVGDPNFTIRFPVQPAGEYVDALFTSAAVKPTLTEREAAISAFGAGGTSGRIAALRSVVDADSVRQTDFRSAFVLAQYYGYLRRGPTDAPEFSDAGYRFWLNKLNAFGGNFRNAELVKAFISSAEYRQRFGMQ